MKSNFQIFGRLMLTITCFCIAARAHGQLSDVPWKAADQISKRGSNQIDYDTEGFVTKIAMEEIPSGFVMGQLEVFQRLQSVSIDSRYYFEDSNMGGIRKLKNLKEFSIRNSRYASSALLELLAEAPALERLTIENCGEISSLHELTRIRRLEHLTIIPDDTMSYMPLIECKNLKTLRLFNSESIDDSAVAEIARITSLRSIDLSQTGITDEGLARLGELPNLDTLILKKCNNITGDAFAEFKNPEVMKELNLEQVKKLTDAGLLELNRFSNLEHLRLHNNRQVLGPGFQCLDSKLNLKTLRCPKTAITDEHLRLLDGIESLEQIWLPSCPGISGRGLLFLAKSTNCKSMSLDECRKIDSPDFDVLARFENLEELYLRSTRIRDDGIEKLCQLKKLGVLDVEDNHWLDDSAFEKLQGCSVKKLLATKLPRLTDRCLSFASNMKNLSHLSLTANRGLTGAGFLSLSLNESLTHVTFEKPEFLTLGALAELKKLSNLEELEFKDGNVSIAQLEQLAGMKNVRRLKYKIEDSISNSERLIAILKSFPRLNQ